MVERKNKMNGNDELPNKSVNYSTRNIDTIDLSSLDRSDLMIEEKKESIISKREKKNQVEVL